MHPAKEGKEKGGRKVQTCGPWPLYASTDIGQVSQVRNRSGDDLYKVGDAAILGVCAPDKITRMQDMYMDLQRCPDFVMSGKLAQRYRLAPILGFLLGFPFGFYQRTVWRIAFAPFFGVVAVVSMGLASRHLLLSLMAFFLLLRRPLGTLRAILSNPLFQSSRHVLAYSLANLCFPSLPFLSLAFLLPALSFHRHISIINSTVTACRR